MKGIHIVIRTYAHMYSLCTVYTWAIRIYTTFIAFCRDGRPERQSDGVYRRRSASCPVAPSAFYSCLYFFSISFI